MTAAERMERAVNASFRALTYPAVTGVSEEDGFMVIAEIAKK